MVQKSLTFFRLVLWYKLGSQGISGKLIKTLRQIYASSKFAIKTSHNRMSGAIPSHSGVLQDCQLSPLLFIIFINDIIEFLQDEDCCAPLVAGQPIHALLFADDVVLCSQTIDGLQHLLDRLKSYCAKWNLEVNKEKTKIVVFKKGTKAAKAERWNYSQYNLETVREFKYLGITFSSNGLWKKHIKEGVRKARTGALQVVKHLFCYVCMMPL